MTLTEPDVFLGDCSGKPQKHSGHSHLKQTFMTLPTVETIVAREKVSSLSSWFSFRIDAPNAVGKNVCDVSIFQHFKSSLS